MKLTAILGLIFVAGIATGCKQSELDSIYGPWKELRVPPAAGSILLEKAARSSCAWKVEANGGVVNIQHVPAQGVQRPRETRAQFAGDLLIGEDRGEWGGSLSVLEGANQTPREILDKDVLQMFPMHEGVVVITGDLPANEGSVWFYSDVRGHDGSIQKKAELHGYPKTIERNGDRILFAFGDAVSTMEQFKERQIAELPLLNVQPNSIAQDGGGNIYVGMNAFVVRLLSHGGGYSQQWFTQSNCF